MTNYTWEKVIKDKTEYVGFWRIPKTTYETVGYIKIYKDKPKKED